jgi:hypothetical protein
MANKNLRFVCAQPAIPYYTWQVETMINNFMSMGINPNNMDIVCWKQNGVIPEEWIKLAERYPCRFLFYEDTRETKHYISSIRPNILKQHWKQFPELRFETILYHDCDIVFTRPPFEWITDEMIDDDKWYGSDTRWYIGHDYIISKGEDVLNAMCDIMKFDSEFIKERELNAIGAQYLMKGIGSEYWERVESDCEILFKDITQLNNEKKKENPSYHELQIWCSDMWAVLWGGWRLGYETICHPNFNFSWGTSSKEEYHNLNIMHNAGVVNSTSGLFYKADYMNKLPYDVEIDIKKDTASYQYWNWIQKTGEISCLK